MEDKDKILQMFVGGNLTGTIARIEEAAEGITKNDCAALLQSANAGPDTLSCAAELKRGAAQINVIIHALGILLCLPYILEDGERVEYVSLGAGNTGRSFDLVTDRRIGEFKFILWQGGSESIRQNAAFKDFVLLAREETAKRKQLFLLGRAHPEKFFKGGRSLKSVLSRNTKLRDTFFGDFGEQFETVGQYFAAHQSLVDIVDVTDWVPGLIGILPEEPDIETEEL